MSHVRLEHITDYSICKRPARGSVFDTGVFANFVPYKNGYIGASRVGSMTHDDRVHVTEYDKSFKVLFSHEVTKGEDPRVFIYNNTPHCITWDPHISELGSRVFDYKLINLISGEVKILSIDNISETKVEILGKNWIPIIKEGVLYFIITIDPQLCIVRYFPDTNSCKWVTPYELVKGGLDITISRGGTSLIYCREKKCFIGLGHRTYDCHNHSAFLYTVSRNFDRVHIGEDIMTNIDRGISDPLSIFLENGKIYTCIAHCPIQLGDTCSSWSSLYRLVLE